MDTFLFESVGLVVWLLDSEVPYPDERDDKGTSKDQLLFFFLAGPIVDGFVPVFRPAGAITNHAWILVRGSR